MGLCFCREFATWADPTPSAEPEWDGGRIPPPLAAEDRMLVQPMSESRGGGSGTSGDAFSGLPSSFRTVSLHFNHRLILTRPNRVSPQEQNSPSVIEGLYS